MRDNKKYVNLQFYSMFTYIFYETKEQTAMRFAPFFLLKRVLPFNNRLIDCCRQEYLSPLLPHLFLRYRKRRFAVHSPGQRAGFDF